MFKLQKLGLHEMKDGRLFRCDVKDLTRLSELYGDEYMPRPL